MIARNCVLPIGKHVNRQQHHMDSMNMPRLCGTLVPLGNSQRRISCFLAHGEVQEEALSQHQPLSESATAFQQEWRN